MSISDVNILQISTSTQYTEKYAIRNVSWAIKNKNTCTHNEGNPSFQLKCVDFVAYVKSD